MPTSSETLPGAPLRRGHTLIFGLLCLLPVVLGGGLFASAGRDDSYLTYWAARSLAETGEILNLSGERIEQSSSLLQTLLLAGLSAATNVSVETLGFVSAIIFGALAVLASAKLATSLHPDTATGILAALLTALAGPLVYWSFGGLETSLAALILASLTIIQVHLLRINRRTARSYLVLSGLTLMLAMVRPDLPLAWIAATLSASMIAWLFTRPLPLSGSQTGALLVAASIGIVSYLLVGAFRWFYFGAFVPQPVSAKVGGEVSPTRGLQYLLDTSLMSPGLAIVFAVALLAIVPVLRDKNLRIAVPVLVLLICCIQVVVAGGDWMELGRLFVPAIPIATALCAVMVRRHTSSAIYPTALAAVLILGLVSAARTDSTGVVLGSDIALSNGSDRPEQPWPWFERRNRVHYRDAVFVESFKPVLERIADGRESVRVASTQAGMVPYYAFRDVDRLEFIDLAGLTSPALEACSDLAPRLQIGWDIDYALWFTHPTNCGVALPDVIFDLGRFSERIAPLDEGREYVEVFSTEGLALSSSSAFPGSAVTADQFVAVRADVLRDSGLVMDSLPPG